MRILVTGGDGFIGKALRMRLCAEGHQVSILSRRTGQQAAEGFRILKGDLRDPGSLEEACEGQEAVFHNAARVGVWGSYPDFHDNNVTGTANLVEACRKKGTRYLIFTSSASVVYTGTDIDGGNEDLPYPARPAYHYTDTKSRAERIVLQADSPEIRTVSLRPHLVWGPGDTNLVPGILARARKGFTPQVGRNKCIIDTTYIDNFIHAQLLALDALVAGRQVSGKPYFITNGEPMPTWDFINRILAAGSLPKARPVVPCKAAYLLGAGLELFHKSFRPAKEPAFTRFLVRELCTSHWFDIGRARTDLGYAPQVSISEGFRMLAEDLACRSAGN